MKGKATKPDPKGNSPLALQSRFPRRETHYLHQISAVCIQSHKSSPIRRKRENQGTHIIGNSLPRIPFSQKYHAWFAWRFSVIQSERKIWSKIPDHHGLHT